MIVSVDDRRAAWFNIFDSTPGQVNIVRLRKGAICAWHRHQHQTDWYFCVSGAVKVGTVTETDSADGNPEDRWVQFVTLDAHHPAVLTIPPDVWHGYGSLTDEAILLQYLSDKYDPSNPDEERKSIEEMGIPWEVRSR